MAMIVTSTLDAIRAKARAIAQVPSPSQLITSPPAPPAPYQVSLDGYINDYYQNDFPEELRLLQLKGNFEFYTIPGQDTYTFPQTFITCETPAYCAGFPMTLRQDQQSFYNLWPIPLQFEFGPQGNGTVGAYTYTTQAQPILQGTVLISDALAQENFTDTVTPGVLTGSAGGSGTVNYKTGAMSWTYASSLASGTQINVQYWPYQAARPLDMLWYNNDGTNVSFVLRPVPDNVYPIKVQAYRQPTQLLSGSNAPELGEWWKVLAIGAATKILEDRMDIEQLANAKALLEDQLRLINRRTLVQLMNQSTPTMYNSAPGFQNAYNLYPYGP